MAALPASPIPLPAAQALTLHAQGLGARPEAAPDAARIHATVRALGCLQIDTLQVVARSQYLALWSRLGCYAPAQLDALLGHDERRCFEFWKKAASIIPLEHYRFSAPRMQERRERPSLAWRRWLARDEAAPAIALVRRRIRAEGGLRAADFEDTRDQRRQWWDWKPAKHALEYLFGCGELMVAERVNFQRVYDLRERVLPAWVDRRPVTLEEADRHDVEQALRALGICAPESLADYAYTSRRRSRPAVAALRAEGRLLEVQCETHGGETRELVLHRERLEDLQRALDGALEPQHTTLLSPFDSLLWSKAQGEIFWGYYHDIELYVPAKKRKWGYFTLPILQRGRLVGRLDPKLERESGTLRLHALHLQPGVTPDERLVSDVAAALKDFMVFHQARQLKFGRRGNAQFRARLRRAL